MTSINSYANRESWAGTYYELAVEVSPRLDDDALANAIDALWSAPQLTGGPWPDKSATKAAMRPMLPEPGDMRSYYGLLAVPELGALRCVSWVIRGSERGSDWLDLSIPTATLEPIGLIHPVDDSPPWVLDALDRTFISVAAHIYAKAPFSLALVGEEVSGALSCESLTREQSLSGRLLLSWRLLTRLQLETIAQRVTEDLFWIPPGCQVGHDAVATAWPPNFGVKLARPGFGPAAELPSLSQRDGVTAVAGRYSRRRSSLASNHRAASASARGTGRAAYTKNVSRANPHFRVCTLSMKLRVLDLNVLLNGRRRPVRSVQTT